MAKLRLTALALLQVVSLAAGAGERTASQVTADAAIAELESALEICDEDTISSANSLVYRSDEPQKVMMYIASVWIPPRGVSQCADNQRIQVFVAGAIAQGYANGMVGQADVQSLRTALRMGIRSKDPETAVASILGLAPVATSADVQEFKRIASDKHYSQREVGLRALAMQCSDEADAAIEELKNVFREDEVAMVRKEMRSFRDAACRKASAH